MKIAIPKERRAGEARVAASPEAVKKYVGLGFEVVVETDAGAGASFADEDFKAAGASIAGDAESALADADVVLKVQRPLTAEEGGPDELKMLKKGAVLAGMLAPLQNQEQVKAYADAGIMALGLELMPRITRAQSMDVLSSQANVAGYKAVIDAAANFGRMYPMLMTAAGTVPPARTVVMGAGVAGLQAIATARRLGGAVSAFDVRAAAKEEVESLGAKFIQVEEGADASTQGGYAAETSEDYKKKQAERIHEVLQKTDIVVCTALIPGRPAPVLVPEETVKAMPAGSVIVDLAVEQGGNCPLSESGKVVEKHGVTIVGHPNTPARVPVSASSLYAKNLLNLFTSLWDKENGQLKLDPEQDDVVKGIQLTRDGAIVNPALTGEGG